MPTSTTSILHADLDAFFASVEQRDNPALRGLPVLVGGPAPRGVIAAASYEARAFGVHSAMPTAEALRLCPTAKLITAEFGRYAQASREFFAILDEFSPSVEPLSLDEAFLDVRGQERLLGDGPTIARAIKRRVAEELSLVVSVGVAPTKFVAKIASDLDKPDGLTIVRPEELLDFLHPLPVARLWGVGKVSQRKLAELGLHTIGDVARFPESSLRARLGKRAGAHLAALARGQDARQVQPEQEATSIGHEETFAFDIVDREELIPVLLAQADRIAVRLRRGDQRAKVVAIKIKYGNFKLITRRRTLPDPSSDGGEIGRAASELLAKVQVDGDHGKRRSVRLCGVHVSGLQDRSAPEQLSFDQPARQRSAQVGEVLDQIQEKFGAQAIGRAIYKKPR